MNRFKTRSKLLLAVTATAVLIVGPQATSSHPVAVTAFAAPTELTVSELTVSYVVYDRGQRVYLEENPNEPFRSASIVKQLIALDYLEQLGPDAAIPSPDQRLLESMLRSSNDTAASTLWIRGGWTDVITRMAGKIGLDHTQPPADPGKWGLTEITAADVVKIYRYLLGVASPTHRGFIMDNLRKATRCATDEFDQSFGIFALPEPHAVKQGWSGFGAGPAEGDRCRTARSDAQTRSSLAELDSPGQRRPAADALASGKVDLTRRVMHTTGTVGPGDEKIVVVLTPDVAED